MSSCVPVCSMWYYMNFSNKILSNCPSTQLIDIGGEEGESHEFSEINIAACLKLEKIIDICSL